MGAELARESEENAGRGEGAAKEPPVHLGAVPKGPRSRRESALHQIPGGNADSGGVQRGIFKTHEARHFSQFMNILFIYVQEGMRLF